MIPIMHQVSSTMRSITLSWPQPEQPNGIILDYELRYYEKAITLIQFCTETLLSDDYAASKNESGYENEFNQKAWDEDPSRQWINAMQTPRVEALIYP
ncbi:ephrin type-B receptor 1 [Tachysurus ichikawai]